LNVLHDRCQGGLYDRQLQTKNIGILVSKLQELLVNDYEQQTIENDDSSHVTCPVVDGQENRKGRQRYVVPGEKLNLFIPNSRQVGYRYYHKTFAYEPQI
jgi:hypothetical protein